MYSGPPSTHVVSVVSVKPSVASRAPHSIQNIHIGNLSAFLPRPLSHAMLSLSLAAMAVLAAAAPSPRLHGRQASWQSYVRPVSSRISPVGIVAGSVEGDVNNPTGLVTGSGTTSISRTTQQGHTCLVVDFGQNVAGLLSIDFASSQVFSAPGNQRPGLTLAFSETLQYLGEADFTRSDNQDGGSVGVTAPCGQKTKVNVSL